MTCRAVRVVWEDASFYKAQMEFDDDLELVPTQSLGWVVRETEKFIAIAQEIEDNGFRRTTVIPKGMILKVVELDPGILARDD